MLRWTSRLRDALEAHGFLATRDNRHVVSSCLQEAEFLCPTGTFPHEFRWKTFVSCYAERSFAQIGGIKVYRKSNADRRDLLPVVDPHQRTDFARPGQLVDNLSDHGVNVLWLSPTVFISRMKFCVSNSFVHDYKVVIHETRCYVIALSAFGEVPGEPSPLPIMFFRHLMETLPSYYRFDCLGFERGQHRCPVDYVIEFLSMIPSDNLKEVVVGGLININELRTILSYHFTPYMELGFGGIPFDDSIPIEALMGLLKESPHLRLVELPWQLINGEQVYSDWGPIPLRIHVISGSLRMSYHLTSAVTSPLIHTLSKVHQVNDETVCWYDVDQSLEWVNSFILPFLDGRLMSKSLKIELYHSHWRGTDAEDRYRGGVAELVANFMTSCTSAHLCYFTVWFHDFEDRWKADSAKLWDESIIPQLVLNYCRREMTNPLRTRFLPLVIGAFNQGIINQKTTDHIPRDMRTANAGLIFQHIHSRAVNRSLLFWK
jgi:hypothetical protein